MSEEAAQVCITVAIVAGVLLLMNLAVSCDRYHACMTNAKEVAACGKP